MRLLNVHTRQVKDFTATKIPRYAILSHTWGRDEVLFQDLTNSEHKKKNGYAKIEGCCRQAIIDGFDFVWIDTCCIDKSSSAELSESINSMYAWYEKAAVCYIYLIDVPSAQDPYRIDSAFRKSRWFTRGWTLQELLAPSKIVFFDQEWDMIFNDSVMAEHEDRKSRRADLPRQRMVLLEEITGIGTKYFEIEFGEASAQIASGCKFSWAAMRETTRPEDAAYCLLGLLQVNMPLLYGEGSKAFQRLQEEVFKKNQDLSILAWGFDMTWRETSLRTNMGLRSYGILAPSSYYFKKFPVSLSKFTNHLKLATHSMMTNLGLNINLPLMCINSSLGIYLAFISGWAIARLGNKHEAFVLPLLKREDQLFERLPGSPPVISVTLTKGSNRRIKWKSIYLIEPKSSPLTWKPRKVNSINDLDFLFFHSSQYTNEHSGFQLYHNQMSTAGFSVRSVFPPGFNDSASHLTWESLSRNFEIILVLSRNNTDCCVIYVRGRTTSRDRIRISKMSISRCRPSLSAWQWPHNLAMTVGSTDLKWGSTVSFDSDPERKIEYASLELNTGVASWHGNFVGIVINHHTGADRQKIGIAL
ncbi:uncharacterized protein EAE97_008116 [Botrytis byssoidea]|uniref:Heterokaryon incompatibility domain-containing protein n=1 Tax=Botrytis byssoidea TaxID=139641 RepID=A0A9P5I9G0_9HELO|nr:uncharacterized protein EAE97_008116 [Botrytis byssoidea]KAF7935209.1 hypothetical protein EAE97_008116 [Botrytis byssoidea]